MRQPAKFQYRDEFAEFLPAHGVLKAASNYLAWMNRAGKILGRIIGPTDLSCEADVQKLMSQLLQLDKHQSIKTHSDENNQISTLRKYVQMVETNYLGRFAQKSSTSTRGAKKADANVRIHFLPSDEYFFDEIVDAARENTRLEWTCPKEAFIGESTFFLINGAGIVAAGFVGSIPTRITNGDFTGRYQAWILGIQIFPGTVPLSVMKSRFPNWGYLDHPQSYTTVASPLADRLCEFLLLYQQNVTGDALPDINYTEGSPRLVTRVEYERSPAARRACLAKWGYCCLACGFDFGRTYGPQFDQIIQVHHLKTIASHKKSYTLNPAKDMRPLCPNCHTIAHLNDPPYTVQEIKQFIAQAQSA